MKLIPFICPNCGANIEVPDDKNKAFCMYCGGTVLITKTSDDGNSPTAQDYFNIAKLELEARDFEKAGMYLAKCIEQEPNYWEYYYYYYKASGYNKYSYFEKAMSLAFDTEKDEKELIKVAKQEIAMERISNAKKWLAKCIEQEPNYWEYYYYSFIASGYDNVDFFEKAMSLASDSDKVNLRKELEKILHKSEKDIKHNINMKAYYWDEVYSSNREINDLVLETEEEKRLRNTTKTIQVLDRDINKLRKVLHLSKFELKEIENEMNTERMKQKYGISVKNFSENEPVAKEISQKLKTSNESDPKGSLIIKSIFIAGVIIFCFILILLQ